MISSLFDSTTMALLLASRLRSPLGELLVASRGPALCGLWFVDQAGIPAWALEAPAPSDMPPVLRATQQQLQGYFSGHLRAFDLPLDIVEGTAFQREVWAALARIPYGQTTSYGQIAAALGRPRAVRAVGGAVGRNPLGIVLPCHRVLGRNGNLTGYTGGLDRKRALLRLEGTD